MKKMLVFALSLVLILSFTACDFSKKPQTEGELSVTENSGNASVTIGEIYTNFGGVNIKIKDVIFNENESTIKVEWVNKTVYDVIYGESYAIEKYKNGKWISCKKTDNLVFNTIGIGLEPTSTQEKAYSFADFFDVSEVGKYRIITDCFVYKNGRGADAEQCNLLAEFTVNCLHRYAEENTQSGTNYISGYCGNTQTTVYIGEDKHTFMGNNSVTLTDILLNLDYKPEVCECRPEYTVDTEFGTGYGISLIGLYARCDKGQADLTKEQAEKISQIIEWVKAEKPDGKEQ